MKWIYHLGIRAFGAFMQLAALFHPKARQWVAGRKNWQARLPGSIPADAFRVWVHCASLGEFEQVRNLIETLKAEQPRLYLMLSFFSPSGYEVRKKYPHADWVGYLPLDTPTNARQWVDQLQPELVFFVKYELWIQVLGELKQRNIPALLIAARLRPSPAWLRPVRAWLYRQGFGAFQQIFAQDAASQQQIRPWVAADQVQIGGDTRYDRVAAVRAEFQPLPEIEAFKRDRLCVICGSTWPEDEKRLFVVIEQLEKLKLPQAICWIIAPHEIQASHIQAGIDRFPQRSLAYSQRESLASRHDFLWIDNIGMLARLYAYADVAYVGGAWDRKVHNILEAAGFGVPVLFGPNYQNLPEAPALIELAACFSASNTDQLQQQFQNLLQDQAQREKSKRQLLAFMQEREGATQQLLDWCRVQGLLAPVS
jgi:3-deoxy-D-manno-octulosonic-acid transferase